MIVAIVALYRAQDLVCNSPIAIPHGVMAGLVPAIHVFPAE